MERVSAKRSAGMRGVVCRWWLLQLILWWRQTATASVYRVGGGAGWTNYVLRTNQLPDYTAWASSNQPFYVDDQFLFQYVPYFHSVHQFQNQSDFEHCDFSHATQLDDGHSGSFMWQAPEIGTFYLGCKTVVEGFGSHCKDGQKVAITVQKRV
ncbi:hypothetical protein KP509_18G063100 [Ceratopteris richardii]|uniref:Phytocyanin domain-containing protein n=1 Tax=Ceratopteris richardii TaxID=49495 RepID=A0A8T2STH2_CERRI|nr:hypothetical protein KP509_18G063100 [Ceratopteris richardii]